MSGVIYVFFFFFKQKTAYEIDCDWSSDVCSSDLSGDATGGGAGDRAQGLQRQVHFLGRSSQIARALVDGVDQTAGQFVEAALAVGLQLLGSQRVTHFLEGLALATTDRGNLDDVIAEIGRASCRERV